MRRAVAERLAHGDALEVEPIGDRAHRRLRAFGVDVPALEVLQRRRVHHHQRRVDDRARRSSARPRARRRSRARREGARDHGERLVGAPRRIDAGRQAHGAHRHAHLARAELSRQLGQGAGLGPHHVGARAAARAMRAMTKLPKVPGGRKTTWPSSRCGAIAAGDVGLRHRRRRDDDRARRRRAPRRCRPSRRANGTSRLPSLVDEDDRAGFDHRLQGGGVAAPEADLVPCFGEIGGGGVGSRGRRRARRSSSPSPRPGTCACHAGRGYTALLLK